MSDDNRPACDVTQGRHSHEADGHNLPSAASLAPLPKIPRRSGSARKAGRRGSVSAAPAVPTIQQSVLFEPSPTPSGTTTPVGSTKPEHPVERVDASLPQHGTEREDKAAGGAATTFVPLTHTSSRLSQRSIRTFVDAPAIITAIPLLGREVEIKRVRTRDAGGCADQKLVSPIDEKDGGEGGSGSEGGGEDDEVEVAVAITSQGEFTYPDGGKEAWLVVAGGVFALFCGFGLTAALGGFQTYYRTYLLSDYSSSSIAWLGGTQAFLTFMLTVFTGSLFDRYGCKPLMATGTILITFGYCMLSLCTKYWQLAICHMTIIPLGINLLFISPVGVIGQWFFLKRGLAFGTTMVGASVGAIIWPTILANLPQRIGFGWTCRLIALISLIFGTTGLFLLKTRLPPRPPGPFFHFQAFKSLPYCLLTIGSFGYVFGFFCILNFIGTYGQIVELGSLAPYLLVILNASSGFGRLGFGLLGDKFGPWNVSIVSICFLSVFYWAWIGMTTPAAMIALAILAGFFSGAYVSLQTPMMVGLADDARLAGTYVGQVLFFQSYSQLVGPPIFGLLLGQGSLDQQKVMAPRAIALGAAMMTLSAVLLSVARYRLQPVLWAKI